MSWRYPAQTPRSLASSVRGGGETEGRTRRATRAAAPRPLLRTVCKAFMTGLLAASLLWGIWRVCQFRAAKAARSGALVTSAGHGGRSRAHRLAGADYAR